MPLGGGSNGTSLSPIEEVRHRTHQPPPGERGQVRSSINWEYLRYFLGDPNPEKLSISTFRRMELDSEVRAGIIIRELFILAKPPAFHPPTQDTEVTGELSARMVDFLTWVWNNLRPTPQVILHEILSARRFGFSVMELVWASTPGPTGPQLRPCNHPDFQGFFYIDRMKLLPPESLEKTGFGFDDFGHLTSVVQAYTATTRPRPNVAHAPATEAATGHVTFTGPDLSRLMVYTANDEGSNPYGTSDHKAAYNPWFSKQSAHAWRSMLLERLSGTIVGEAGPGQEAKLEEALEDLGPGAVLTLPSGSKVSLLQGWEGAVRSYTEAMEYDDGQILRAYLVPKLAAGGGQKDTGSFARAASDVDMLAMVCRSIQLEVEDLIEEHFVKPLIDANFGPQASYPTFDFPELQEKDREALARIYTAAIRDGYVDPAIDAGWLRREMNVPEDPPEGWAFEKPTVGLPEWPPEHHGREDAGPHTVAAQRAPTPNPATFDRIDANGKRLLIARLEGTTRATLTDAAATARNRILEQPPKDGTPAELSRLHVDPAWLQDALDAVAQRILHTTTEDVARKLRALGRDDAATTVLHLSQAPDGAAIAAAQDAPEDALRSFTRWSRSFNEIEAQRGAAELAGRLRMRALQGFESGQGADAVAQGLAEEFDAYTLAQVNNITRTALFDYYNSARNATIDAIGTSVAGVVLRPVLDDDTTPFCRDITDRSISRLDPHYEQVRNPPYWHGCRTTVVPIFSDEPWTFNTDWAEWLAAHAGVEGGGFVYAGGLA